MFDYNHLDFCTDSSFHNIFGEAFEDSCICRYCGEKLEHYHSRFGCDPFKYFPQDNIFQTDTITNDVWGGGLFHLTFSPYFFTIQTKMNLNATTVNILPPPPNKV